MLLHEDADPLELMSQPQAPWSVALPAHGAPGGLFRPPLVARLLTCALLGGAAWGLGLRHDVAEEKYLELGRRFPALIRVEGPAATWHVAGVIAAIDDGDEDRIVSEYGEDFVLTSVAPYADWIRETIGE